MTWRAVLPLLELWMLLRGRELAHVPRPTGAPRAHAEGAHPDRVLIVGDGPAVGWGVVRHDLALPGTLARALRRDTARGVDVDVVADPELHIARAFDAIGGVVLDRYDAVLLVLGTNDARRLVPQEVWSRQLRRLIRRVREELPDGGIVAVAGIPADPVPGGPLGRMVTRHGERLDAVTSAICRREGAIFVRLATAVDPRAGDGGSARYDHWGGVVAERLAPALRRRRRDPPAVGHGGDLGPGAEHDVDREVRRQRAVESVGLLDTGREERFDRIVQRAQTIFRVRGAAFTLIDRDRLWVKAHVGVSKTELPRSEVFCSWTIRRSGALIVPDAGADPRFRDSPHVRGEDGVRFYAGYPVESPSGERVGTLCVVDPRPRDAAEFDEALLRELALLVQQELWRSAADSQAGAVPDP